MWPRFAPLGIVCALAVGRVALSKPLPEAPRADATLVQTLYNDLKGRERESRQKAAQDFPTDPWSCDDAFHAFEAERVSDLARTRHTPVSDVLAALDDGMRAANARGERTLTPSVPPCHPRAIY